MRVVADSHAIYWYLTGPGELSGRALEELAAHVDLDAGQYLEVRELAERMWRLMVEDPYSPQCLECGEALPTPAVPRMAEGTLRPGRPRQYCSDACRQAAYRARQGD